MKVYYTVIPKLFDDGGKPLQDIEDMKPLAIVRLFDNRIRVYNLMEAPWSPITGQSFKELENILRRMQDALPNSVSLFHLPTDYKEEAFAEATTMIDKFFYDIRLLSADFDELEVHAYNSGFDVECLRNAAKGTDYDLQGAMRALHPTIFSKGEDTKMLNSYSTRHIPTIRTNLKYVDGVTTHGFKVTKGALSSLALSKVFSLAAGIQYVPYWYALKKEVTGLPAHQDMVRDMPLHFFAEELFVLYQNRYLAETLNV